MIAAQVEAILGRSFDRLRKELFRFNREMKRLKFDVQNRKDRWRCRKHTKASRADFGAIDGKRLVRKIVEDHPVLKALKKFQSS